MPILFRSCHKSILVSFHVSVCFLLVPRVIKFYCVVCRFEEVKINLTYKGSEPSPH